MRARAIDGSLLNEPYVTQLAKDGYAKLARADEAVKHHFRSIARALDLGSGTARYHLDVLLRRGLIREDRALGHCRFYLDGPGSEPERNALYEKHWEYRDWSTRVLRVLQRTGAATPTEVGRALGMSRQLASYHLRHLERSGLVLRRDGRYRAARSARSGARPRA